MTDGTTIAALATPPGVGGIAVIRLSGPKSYDIASKIFVPKSREKQIINAPGYTALYGHFTSGGMVVDDGIALCFRAPASYTGEDMIELSCHGGEGVSAAVLAACLENGASPAAPGEYTRRAFLNGRLSLAQAEAVMELVEATSRQGAAQAQAALGGSLMAVIDEVKGQLVTLAGHLAAWVDFPEEDVEDFTLEQYRQVAGGARQTLGQLIAGYGSGVILRRGVQAAIVGSPNVGKSTLFNLLSGCQRAIVTPVAGTTRDVVREQVNLGGLVLNLADTAGMRETGDIVEAEGIRRSGVELDKAEIVLAVFDGSQPLGPADTAVAQRCRGLRALGIVNKSDLEMQLDVKQLEPYFSRVIVVTAKEKNTVKIIENTLEEMLGLKETSPDAASLQSQRQLAAAVAADAALQEGLAALENGLGLDAAGACLDEALAQLAQLTGEAASDAVIDEVFSKFCVGK